MKKDFLVLDNFFPSEVHTKMKKLLIGDGSPWFFCPCIDYESEDEINDITKYQFIHYFFKDGEWVSNPTPVLPLYNKLKPASLLKIKANLQPRSETLTVNSFHVDIGGYPPGHITAIYYLNTCNGKTIFESGEEIESVENRLLLFSGDKRHTGTSVTDSKVRCLINFNFIQDPNESWL
jgi:hypothetical protein